MKPHPVIVIGRSFGAGGIAIGRALSIRLGIPVYDKELLKTSAEEFGFKKEIFERTDEKRPSLLRRLVTQSYGVQENFVAVPCNAENLYEAQSRVIRAIAKQEPCIIIGRTADYILRDFPGLVSIFIHAPLAYRAHRIVERGDASSDIDAIELAKRRDKSRQEYYNYFTGRQWGLATNYDLTLNASLLTIDGAAQLIADYIGLKKF